MNQMRIETSHASIDMKDIEQIYLYYFESVTYKHIIYILCSSAYIRRGFVTINL